VCATLRFLKINMRADTAPSFYCISNRAQSPTINHPMRYAEIQRTYGLHRPIRSILRHGGVRGSDALLFRFFNRKGLKSCEVPCDLPMIGQAYPQSAWCSAGMFATLQWSNIYPKEGGNLAHNRKNFILRWPRKLVKVVSYCKECETFRSIRFVLHFLLIVKTGLHISEDKACYGQTQAKLEKKQSCFLIYYVSLFCKNCSRIGGYLYR